MIPGVGNLGASPDRGWAVGVLSILKNRYPEIAYYKLVYGK